MSATIEVVKTEAVIKNNIRYSLNENHVPICGQACLLTLGTLFRRPVFRDFEAAKSVAAVHKLRWVWRHSQVLAWVLMPDQWHALVAVDQEDDLNQLIGRFKSATARGLDDRYKINGWLWGRGFQQQALKDDVELRDTGRYLITHPIRAGLVDEIGKYPYWDAVWVAGGNNKNDWPRSRA
jgi:putative transposase